MRALHSPGVTPPADMVDEAAFSISAAEALLLLDWKRRIGDLYRDVREATAPIAGWERWRAGRHRLFASHPRSPVPPARRAAFEGHRYFPYDPAFRVLADVVDAEPLQLRIDGSSGGAFALTRFAVAGFELADAALSLELYWIGEYRGGLFVPFGDATNSETTYGGGRYLIDTLKGQDLGVEAGSLVLDFNYAYHPPCYFNPEWSCPLPPPANRLPVPVPAGEQVAG